MILDNIIFSLQKAGGISVYWFELQKRLIKDSQKLHIYERQNNNIFCNLLPEYEKKVESNINVNLLRYLPFLKRLPQNEIFHSSYYRVSLQKNVKNIVTVHDFTYEKFRSGLARMVHKIQKGFAIRKADGIICVSENTKKDLMFYYPTSQKKSVCVIHNGVGNEFMLLDEKDKKISEKYPELSNKTFIIFVGDRKGYKNFNCAVDSITGNYDMNLIIIGGGQLTDKERKYLDDKISNRYYHYSGISSEDLNLLYNCAFALVYPSLYEGFGIPVIEAMRAGCPVIASNNSSIPEIADNAAILLDNISPSNVKEKLDELSDNFKKEFIIKKGLEQSVKFSWDKCYTKTLDFYKNIAKDNIF